MNNAQQEPTVEKQSCGCLVTRQPGHTHTKLCWDHRSEYFNRDLIGGSNDQGSFSIRRSS